MVEARPGPTALRPGYMAALFGVLALVLVTFAYYGLQQARESTLETMERGARSLAEENVLRAEADMEALVGERLLDNARLIAERAAAQGLPDTALARIARDNHLERIDWLDHDAVIRASSGRVGAGEWADWREALAPLVGGIEDAVLFELDARLFAVAVAVPGGGAVGLLIAGVLQGLADFRTGGSVGLHALDQRLDFLALGLTGSAPGFARGGAVCKALG